MEEEPRKREPLLGPGFGLIGLAALIVFAVARTPAAGPFWRAVGDLVR